MLANVQPVSHVLGGHLLFCVSLASNKTQEEQLYSTHTAVHGKVVAFNISFFFSDQQPCRPDLSPTDATKPAF